MSTQKILNPFIWKDNILRQEVKDALDNIVIQFIDELEANNIPIDIVDVHIVGSNASYNYELTSDLDVHVVADFSNINCNEKVLELLYNFFKSYFNNKYNISVHGIKVELYIENQKTPSKSNGIYSLVDDEWIKFPEQVDVIEVDIEQELSYWLEEYNKIIASNNMELLQDFLNRLYILRRDSLINEGEYGKGNLIFKHFRNNGYINTIKDLLTQNISQSLTLESVSEILKENAGFGYHYGDLGKAEYKHNFGNRSTGGFGTGTYFIGKPISQLKYKSAYSNRPEHKIDLEKYNLYTPKSNELAYLLHDALLRINNEAANGAEKLIRVDEVLDEYGKMLDTYFQDYRNIQETAAKQYIDKYKDIVDDSYSDEELIEQARYIRDTLLDIAHKDEQILRDLSRALGIYDTDKLSNIVNKALQDTSDIAPSTLIMKQLGYDGVDVRHLNKDADGLSGLDNFSYGSVIYDLKEAHQDQTVSADNSQLIPLVEKEFGVSSSPVSGPTFLMPDGRFLTIADTFERRNSIEDFPCHAEVQHFLKSHNLTDAPGDYTDGSPVLSELGAIRINDVEEENNYIELSPKYPTPSQLESLLWHLDNNSARYRTVIVTDPGMNNFVTYDYSKTITDDIVKNIKRYYASHVLYEDYLDAPNVITEAHQDQTVYTAISRYEDFVYKYGKNSALFELKYKYHLTDEELVYIINRLVKKGLMDEYTKAYNVSTLGLEEYFK